MAGTDRWPVGSGVGEAVGGVDEAEAGRWHSYLAPETEKETARPPPDPAGGEDIGGLAAAAATAAAAAAAVGGAPSATVQELPAGSKRAVTASTADWGRDQHEKHQQQQGKPPISSPVPARTGGPASAPTSNLQPAGKKQTRPPPAIASAAGLRRGGRRTVTGGGASGYGLKKRPEGLGMRVLLPGQGARDYSSLLKGTGTLRGRELEARMATAEAEVSRRYSPSVMHGLRPTCFMGFGRLGNPLFDLSRPAVLSSSLTIAAVTATDMFSPSENWDHRLKLARGGLVSLCMYPMRKHMGN